MKLQDKQQLLELLKQFLNEYDMNQRDALNKNAVFKLLKAHLEKKGRWKNLNRGKNIN